VRCYDSNNAKDASKQYAQIAGTLNIVPSPAQVSNNNNIASANFVKTHRITSPL